MIREIVSPARLSAMPPEDAAATWLVRRSQGFHPAEEQAFEQWLAAGPANREAWARAQRAWQCFDDEEGDELLGAIRDRALSAGPERTGFSGRRAAAAAAAVLVLAGAAAVWLRPAPAPPRPVVAQGGPAPLERFGSADYATAKGAQRTVRMPDGSRLTLDTDSAVDLAFQPGRRSIVLLRGRASFTVARDPARPFAVRAGGREVIALGTRFDVRLDPGKVQVTLIEGRVAVRSIESGLPPVTLKPGEKLVDTGGRTTVSSVPVEEASDWRRGLLTFHDDTLTTAAGELNRYYERRLIVRDPQVARLRVSGSFRAGDPVRFARSVSQIHPVRAVRREDGTVELVSAD